MYVCLWEGGGKRKKGGGGGGRVRQSRREIQRGEAREGERGKGVEIFRGCKDKRDRDRER